MYLLNDSTLKSVAGSNSVFYILAWLPVALIAIFTIRGILQKKKGK